MTLRLITDVAEITPAGANLLACPGVDVDKFQASCRLPLSAGQWQIWRLRRTNIDNAPPHVAVGDGGPTWNGLSGYLPGARYILDWWFRHLTGGEQLWTSAFDHLALTNGAPTRLGGAPIPAGGLVRIASAGDKERRESCSQPITVRTGPGAATDVYAAFVYRGSFASMPWPAYKFDVLSIIPGTVNGMWETWCPVSADLVVEDVWTLTEKAREVVPVPAPAPSVVDSISQFTDLFDPAKVGAAGVAMSVGVSAALVLGVGYLIYSARKAR